jgi:ribosomal protein L7/L12
MTPIFEDDRGFARMNADQGQSMKRVVVCGGKLNFNKIGFTKFLRAEFGYSLSEAKGMTDGLLNHRSVIFEIADDQLEELRADFRMEEV